MDVLVVVVLDHRERALVHVQPERRLRLRIEDVAEVELVMDLGPPVGRPTLVGEGQQAAPVALPRARRAEPFHDRREGVDRLGEIVDDGAARRIRLGRGIAQDHRNAEALVEIADLAQHVMVAELLAMVAGEEDQRVLPLPRLLQEGEDLAEVIVDLRHQGAIGRAHLADLGVAQILGEALGVLEEAAAADMVDVEVEQWMLPRLFGRRGGADRRGHVGRVVHRIVRRRRDELRMRPVVAEMEEPVPVAPALEVGQAAVGEIGGVAELGRDARGRGVGPGTASSPSGIQMSARGCGSGKSLPATQPK